MSIIQPIMFKRFDHVIFKPVNPYSDSEKPQKYKAIIFNNSQEDNKSHEITHFLEFENSSILRFFKMDESKIRKSYYYYTKLGNDSNISPSIKERINYSIGVRYDEDDKRKNNNNNKLFMIITFNDYKNNNVVYKQNKINSQILGDQKRNLKSVRPNPKNKSFRLHENKHDQQVKVTDEIIKIEQDIEDLNYKCEDGIAKLNETLNAEIGMEYLKQKGLFDNTIFRLGHKKSSKNTFLKRRAKSVGGIKTRRKSRRK